MSQYRWGWVVVLLAVVWGCRSNLPELGTVSGHVTMDGKPLAGAVVEFNSEKGGRPGMGVTDAEGYYELRYTGDAKGTLTGPAKVSITTQWPEGEVPAGQKEPIPEIYNTKTTLVRTVEPGRNTFDFELQSQ